MFIATKVRDKNSHVSFAKPKKAISSAGDSHTDTTHRRRLYESIAEGNAFAEVEEMARRQWRDYHRLRNKKDKTERQQSSFRDLSIYIITLVMGSLLLSALVGSISLQATQSSTDETTNIFDAIRVTDEEAQEMVEHFNIQGGPNITSIDIVYIFARIGFLVKHNPHILKDQRTFEFAVRADAGREATLYTVFAFHDLLIDQAFQFYVYKLSPTIHLNIS